MAKKTGNTAAISNNKPKKKTKNATRKNPQAPKRFRSSYILFFVHSQDRIKREIPNATAPEVSKRASELWKGLSAQERSYWDNQAYQEKQRYVVEKAAYTGTWQVPNKRAKKDPTAPKRNPSAFLLFSQDKRSSLKVKHPEMKNTDISRILGIAWRDASEEERLPFILREEKEREDYKYKMDLWKKSQAEKADEVHNLDKDPFSSSSVTPLPPFPDPVKSVFHPVQNQMYNTTLSMGDCSHDDRYAQFIPPRGYPTQPYYNHGQMYQQQQPHQSNPGNSHASYPPHIVKSYPGVVNQFDPYERDHYLEFSHSADFMDDTDNIPHPFHFESDDFDPVPIH